MSTVDYSYLVVASGIASAESAPVTGSARGGLVRFRVRSDDWAVLPELRRWIAGAGGTVETETGTPAPAKVLDDDGLYVVALDASEDIPVQGVRRVEAACAQCGLPVARLHRDAPSGRAGEDPTLPVVATAQSCWLVRPEIVADLGAGIESMEVQAPGGAWAGCWPDRQLASVPVAGTRCGTCLRVVTSAGVESVPRYSLGLLVEQPADPHGWWWHSRLGQHLPILSGDVVARLRTHVEVSALPVLTDPATAFLPEELR